MLYFKDTKNGTICRAIGFLFLHKSMSWDRIENVLVDTGMTQSEAKIQISNEKALLSLYENIDRFRSDYSSSLAKNTQVTKFGDWMLISRCEFYDVFRSVFEESIQKSSEYNLCLMRDESGIPTCVHVYSSGHRFLGRVNLGVTESTILIQYDSKIDKSSWNFSKQILLQEIDVASFADNLSQEGSDIPIGLIVSCGSAPNYGSVQFPKTFWISKYDEPPHKIINFFNGEGSLMTCRLPNKSNEPFAPVTSFSSLFLSQRSVNFCKDISAFAGRNKKNDIDDFVKCYLATSSINRESKSTLIREYSKRIGIDYEKAMSLIKKYGIGSDTLTVEGKTYFVKDSKYFAIKKGSIGSEASNFFVQPEVVYDVDGKRRMVEGYFVVEGVVNSFCINRDSFLNSCKFLRELVAIADKSKSSTPLIYSSSDVVHIRRMILVAIDAASIVQAKEFGLHGHTRYTSSSWEAKDGKIKIFQNSLPLAGQKEFICKRISESEKTYSSIAKKELAAICKNESVKTLVFLILKTINTRVNNGTSRLYVTRNTFFSCAKILGLSASESIVENNQFQLSTNDCNVQFANKNNVLSIVLHNSILSKAKNTTTFTEDIILTESLVPLLPELINLALVESPAKAMQTICNTDYIDELAREERLSYVFRSGESKYFFESVKDLSLEKEYFHEEEDGSLVIEITRCIKTLKSYGISLSKKMIIKDLRDSGIRFIYPIRKFKDRATCLKIYKQNKEILNTLNL